MTHLLWIYIYAFQRCRTKNEQSTKQEQKQNRFGSKPRAVAITDSKYVINCPVCPVRVSSDIFLLDHFYRRHRGCKYEPIKEHPVCRIPRKEVLQRIRRLFNTYSHTRETLSDWSCFARQMGKVCIHNDISCVKSYL